MLSSFCSRLCELLYLTHHWLLHYVVLFQPQDLCSCHTGLLHVIWSLLLLYLAAAEEKEIMHLYDTSHVCLVSYSMINKTSNLQFKTSNKLKHVPSVTLLSKTTVAERMWGCAGSASICADLFFFVVLKSKKFMSHKNEAHTHSILFFNFYLTN